jgi:hypothetical protein
MNRIALLALPALVAIALAVAGASVASAEEFEERISLDAQELALTNLIGEVDLEGHDGSGFEVLVQVKGKDAGRDKVRIETKKGDHAEVNVIFPVGEDGKFVYPRLGSGSNTTITVPKHASSREGPLDRVLRSIGARHVNVKGHGSGKEIWADVTIRVPRDRNVTVDLAVGSIEASNVASAVNLRVQSGPISAKSMTGDLEADTGSGKVEVIGSKGEVLKVDTGSGSVEVRDADCRRLDVDTGSGGVTCAGISADAGVIDTGSGSVELACTRIGDGRFTIDTGSGSVELRLPRDASARVTADTGAGGIHLDVGDVEMLSREDNTVSFRMGDGAADIRIDTGSGSISVSR